MNVSASERGFGIGGRDGPGWGLVGGAGARGCGCFPGAKGGMLFVHRRGGRGVVSPGGWRGGGGWGGGGGWAGGGSVMVEVRGIGERCVDGGGGGRGGGREVGEWGGGAGVCRGGMGGEFCV